jgi:hypothetical protein
VTAGSGNGRDAGRERAELVARLRGLPAKARMDALLDAKDAGALVRAVPPQELYQTVVEVGLADATELVQLASPAQFRSLVDLGAWKGDRIEPHQLLTWLRAARGDEPEDFLAKLAGLDLELIEHLLRAFCVVHDLEENPDVHAEGVTLETPEGKYLIEFTVDGPELSALRSLVNDLIARDPFEASRLIEAVRWELPTELEETAHQFRMARLSDLGFPELYEALSLYTYVDPAKEQVGPTDSTALAPASRVDFLDAALRALSADERDALEQELRYLVNSALVADAADPGDLDALRRAGERAKDSLCLGLEHLSNGEAQRAADVVREHPLRHVFRVGFSLTLSLKFAADRLAKLPGARRKDGYWLMPFEEATVVALRRKRPLRALKVDGAEPVSFRSRAELLETQALLTRAALQVEVFQALRNDVSPESLAQRFGGGVEGAAPESVLGAAMASALLDGKAVLVPVPAARVQALAQACFEGGVSAPRVREDARAKVLSVLQPLVGDAARIELERMVRACFDLWLAEAAVPFFMAPEALDPRGWPSLPVEGFLDL